MYWRAGCWGIYLAPSQGWYIEAYSPHDPFTFLLSILSLSSLIQSYDTSPPKAAKMGLGDIMKNRSALKTSNTSVTTAAQLTLRQSLYPLALVTSLFFLWVSGLMNPPPRAHLSSGLQFERGH